MTAVLRIVVAFLTLLAGAAFAEGSLLQPWGRGPTPAQPWHVAGLPQQSKPFTRFEVVELDGQRVLRVEAESSYGNLVHPLHLESPPAALRVAWRWRLDQALDAADIRKRATEDIALKVCVFFDEPMAQVPFVERQVLRLARVRAGEWLPSATVCYVWDSRLPVGTTLRSPYTGRVRYVVVESAPELQRWHDARRDTVADYLRLFADESDAVPPVIGVGIGADADNTQGRSLGYIAELMLSP